MKKLLSDMGNSTMTYPIGRKPKVSGSALWWRRFLIRLCHWEYWPMYVFNIPVRFIWLWNAIRCRDLFFFAATNPAIPTGGFFGESKSDILKMVPDAYKPKTVLWKGPIAQHDVEKLFTESGLQFPVIAKPEVGERGWLISRINNVQELKQHVRTHTVDMILQPFILSPIEVSIMVYRLPDGSKSDVTSICQKEFLHVIGDGLSTIEELILRRIAPYYNWKSSLANSGIAFMKFFHPVNISFLNRLAIIAGVLSLSMQMRKSMHPFET